MLTPYERACRNAVQVQDACNFSGALRSFAEDMAAVHDHLQAEGNNHSVARATHPVAILYMNKLHDLQRFPGSDEYGAAYDHCQQVAETAQARESLEVEV